MGLRSKFWMLGLAAITGLVCLSDSAMAQGRGGRGGPGGMFGQDSALGLVGQESVKKELELVDDQVEAIEALQEQQRAEMQEMFSDIRQRFQGLEPEARREAWAEIQEEMKTLNKDFEGKVFAELLPHQIDRLKQLVLQSESRRSGGATAGTLPASLVEELDISEEQLEAMKKKAEEVRAKMEEKIAKIRAQAEEEILSVLDSGQREKYKQLVGDSFDFNQDRGRGGWGGRGGAGGGRGGAGGGRGGRGGGDAENGRGGRGSDF